MAEIVAVTPTTDGNTITMGAANNADTAKTGPHRLLLVNNASGGSINVTIAVPGNTVTGEAMPDNVIAVANGALVAIPLLDVYRDPDTRTAAITYSGTSSVTRAVVQA